MNWLVCVVMVILLWNVLRGYQKGAMRMVFSLLSIIVSIILATYLTPIISDYLIQNTQIAEKIEEKAEDNIRQMVLDGLFDSSTSSALFNVLGIELPENVISSVRELKNQSDELTNQTEQLPNQSDKMTNSSAEINSIIDVILADAGIYKMFSEKIAQLCINVIAFIAIMIIVNIVLATILLFIKSIEKLPLIGELNKGLGLLIGFVKGMFIVWVFLAVVMIYAMLSNDQTTIDLIYQNKLLQIINAINPITKIFETIIK